MKRIHKNIFEESSLEWLAETYRMNPLNNTAAIGWNHAKQPAFSGAGYKKVWEILAGDALKVAAKIHYTEDALVQQTTAEYLEQTLSWKSVFAYNNEEFEPGKIWHWYERWVDVSRKPCRDSGGEHI